MSDQTPAALPLIGGRQPLVRQIIRLGNIDHPHVGKWYAVDSDNSAFYLRHDGKWRDGINCETLDGLWPSAEAATSAVLAFANNQTPAAGLESKAEFRAWLTDHLAGAFWSARGAESLMDDIAAKAAEIFQAPSHPPLGAWQDRPTLPGWYECRFLRNPPDFRVARWWNGKRLSSVPRDSDTPLNVGEYTDFVFLGCPTPPATEKGA
jgi:hypothetical protein